MFFSNVFFKKIRSSSSADCACSLAQIVQYVEHEFCNIQGSLVLSPVVTKILRDLWTLTLSLLVIYLTPMVKKLGTVVGHLRSNYWLVIQESRLGDCWDLTVLNSTLIPNKKAVCAERYQCISIWPWSHVKRT